QIRQPNRDGGGRRSRPLETRAPRPAGRNARAGSRRLAGCRLQHEGAPLHQGDACAARPLLPYHGRVRPARNRACPRRRRAPRLRSDIAAAQRHDDRGAVLCASVEVDTQIKPGEPRGWPRSAPHPGAKTVGVGKRTRGSEKPLGVVAMGESTIIVPFPQDGRPPPPEHLSSQKAETWKATVGSRKAGYFGPEIVPLLQAYSPTP